MLIKCTVILGLIASLASSGCYTAATEIQKISLEINETDKFAHQNIVKALGNIADDENYQLLCEYTQRAKTDKASASLLKKLLFQRYGELTSYRDGFCLNNSGKISFAFLAGLGGMIFYINRMSNNLNYTAMDAATLASLNAQFHTIHDPIKKSIPGLVLSTFTTCIALIMTIYGAGAEHSYKEMRGDLQIERIRALLSYSFGLTPNIELPRITKKELYAEN